MKENPISVQESIPLLTHREERELFNRQWTEEKRDRELHNQQLFTGWRGSVFLREGSRTTFPHSAQISPF